MAVCSIRVLTAGRVINQLKLVALLRGAEMGKIKHEGMSREQEKATNAVQTFFAFAMGATLPLQVRDALLFNYNSARVILTLITIF